MRRVLLIACAWGGLALGVTQAAPARPLHDLSDPPGEKPAADLSGTLWRGSLLIDGVEVTFAANGKLTYMRPWRFSTGSWVRTSNYIVFAIGHDTEHRGMIIGDVIVGESTSNVGAQATFQLRRVRGAE